MITRDERPSGDGDEVSPELADSLTRAVLRALGLDTPEAPEPQSGSIPA